MSLMACWYPSRVADTFTYMVDLKWVGEHDKIEVGREDLNLKRGVKVKVMGIS